MALEHFDVLIIGAGLSGIGAACHLRERLPDKTFAILEARAAVGGTWDLFRYPGIRSDSDMFTLGYAFRPWRDTQGIAEGGRIRSYIEDTAREHDVLRHVRFEQRVVSASWSSHDARWTLELVHLASGETRHLSCNFLFCCAGYYRYDKGYTPHFDAQDEFRGTVIHPQHWPEDLDYTGKRVVVIGSGATAVTIVPAMAERAGHVTMLQRSPSYVVSLPGSDPLAEQLAQRVPAKLGYALVRWKNLLIAMAIYQASRRQPGLVKRLIRMDLARRLPDDYPVDTHFKPRYEPWDQRMCLVPDGDLFKPLSEGKASIVTDEIERFTPRGILLKSGTELEADIIVTATGLNLQLMGGMSLTADGKPIDLAQTTNYKGMMYSGVPNFVLVLGYTNASWTLKADLVSQYVCRLLKYMDEHGYRKCTPGAPTVSDGEPFFDLSAGYVQRARATLPKQGKRAPWRLYQNYLLDLGLMRFSKIADEGIAFSR